MLHKGAPFAMLLIVNSSAHTSSGEICILSASGWKATNVERVALPI
jgi:hypothetical protein